MIGIAYPKLWNLGVGLLSKWNSLTFFFLFILSIIVILLTINYSMPHSAFVLRPITLPQMRSSSLICLLAVIVASRENQCLHL